MKKGLISYKLKNNIKIFMPAPVESFNELVEKKQKGLDEQKEKVTYAIKKLKQTPKIDTTSDYKYFEGISGIKSLLNEVANYMEHFGKKSILKLYGQPRKQSEMLRGFYNEFHKKRLKFGHKYKLISSKGDEEHNKLRKSQNSEVRVMDLKNDASFAVFEDYFIAQHVSGKTPVGFLIKNRKIAESFDQIYEQVWKTASK